MSAHRVVGRSHVRQDARAKVTGEYRYGMDFALPGMLHGHILRSPHPHARILALDASQAKASPGVRAVITGEDLGTVMMPGVVEDQPPLARGRVRYVGEPVALVAADTLEIATQAAGLIRVEYEPLPFLSDAEEAMQSDAMLIHENWEGYAAADGLVREGNVCCHASLTCGDVEKGFAEADRVIEGSFSTESVHQSHVEPRAAVAVMEGENKVAVYTNTQLPYWIRTNVATVLGLPERDVRVVTTGIGGGFGSKLYPQLEPLAALLARQTRRPVRMVTPLEDELIAGLPRHPFKLYLKTGVKGDGTLVARQARLILDTGAYAGSGPEIASVAVLCAMGPYRTSHLQVDAYAVLTSKTNFGAYRGPGGVQPVFALESHFDDVADALGMDPLTFRLKNVLREGDEALNGQVVTGVGLSEALQKCAEALEWDEPAESNRGKGLACGWWTTTLGASGCLAKLDVDGTFVVTVGTQEIGTGAVMGGVPLVMAELMGVSPEDVRVEVADTAIGPYDFGSQGSRTLFNVGLAVQRAAEDLTLQILNLAGEMMEIAADDLELWEGAVIVKGAPDRKLSLAEVAQKAVQVKGGLHSHGLSLPESFSHDEKLMVSCFYPAFHYPSFYCHGAEVEVDPGTGEVTVLRYVAAHDVGFAVNPALAAGQIQGGAVQGIGMGLMEEIIYRDGHVLNDNWTDYKLPTIADVPDVQAVLVEHPSHGGTFGNKGLGEPPVVAPPGALANAVRRAAGVRIRNLPMTAEKILFAMREAADE